MEEARKDASKQDDVNIYEEERRLREKLKAARAHEEGVYQKLLTSCARGPDELHETRRRMHFYLRASAERENIERKLREVTDEIVSRERRNPHYRRQLNGYGNRE